VPKLTSSFFFCPEQLIPYHSISPLSQWNFNTSRSGLFQMIKTFLNTHVHTTVLKITERLFCNGEGQGSAK